jgi:hemerythrin HHE cation binding domain-containing protein
LSQERGETGLDAIGELRKDHRAVEARLNELTKTSSKAARRRRKLLKQLTDELARHLDLEEQLVFPLAEREARAKDAVLKAQEQHEVIKNLLNGLGSTDPQEERFQPRMEVLNDLVHGHVVEEQRTVYSPLRGALTSQQLRDLGQRIREGREAMANPKDYLRSN